MNTKDFGGDTILSLQICLLSLVFYICKVSGCFRDPSPDQTRQISWFTSILLHEHCNALWVKSITVPQWFSQDRSWSICAPSFLEFVNTEIHFLPFIIMATIVQFDKYTKFNIMIVVLVVILTTIPVPKTLHNMFCMIVWPSWISEMIGGDWLKTISWGWLKTISDSFTNLSLTTEVFTKLTVGNLFNFLGTTVKTVECLYGKPKTVIEFLCTAPDNKLAEIRQKCEGYFEGYFEQWCTSFGILRLVIKTIPHFNYTVLLLQNTLTCGVLLMLITTKRSWIYKILQCGMTLFVVLMLYQSIANDAKIPTSFLSGVLSSVLIGVAGLAKSFFNLWRLEQYKTNSPISFSIKQLGMWILGFVLVYIFVDIKIKSVIHTILAPNFFPVKQFTKRDEKKNYVRKKKLSNASSGKDAGPQTEWNKVIICKIMNWIPTIIRLIFAINPVVQASMYLVE